MTIENSSFRNIMDITNNQDYFGSYIAPTDYFGSFGWFGSDKGIIYNIGNFKIKNTSFNNVKTKTGGQYITQELELLKIQILII